MGRVYFLAYNPEINYRDRHFCDFPQLFAAPGVDTCGYQLAASTETRPNVL